MKLGSLFDGIGGWQLAAVRIGIKPTWSSEIDKFCCYVTKKHFPNTKQLGDITKINGAEIEPVDIICAGSPCQNLSIAGNRKGLAGEQSGLFSAAINIVRQMQRATNNRYPRFFVWENVPGAFTSNKGADFKTVLEKIMQTKISMPISGKWSQSGLVRSRRSELAWRVLDAQYWGVPQRRKRIFLVADFTGQCAGEILFESKSMSRNTKKSRKKESCSSTAFENSFRTSIYDMTHANDVIRKVNGGIIQTLTSRMGTGGNQVPIIQRAYTVSGYGKYKEGIGTLRASGGDTGPGSENITFSIQRSDSYKASNISHTLSQRDYKSATDLCVSAPAVRRLTPLECERLQGLPDNWTAGGSDTARYKAIGNGMAQPCADWIIKMIVEVTKN